jgi:hypothetical protein
MLQKGGKIPWTGDQWVAMPLICTGQHRKKKESKHPCLDWDSNPWSSYSNVEDISCLGPCGHCNLSRYIYIRNFQQIETQLLIASVAALELKCNPYKVFAILFSCTIVCIKIFVNGETENFHYLKKSHLILGPG